jgi:DNA/RNA endonuclease YhcR with UshA esterase domain
MRRLLVMRTRVTACLLTLVAVSSTAFASQSLTSVDARSHIGETATVCGKVASAHYAARSHGEPTFLNLDKPYPNAPFTVVIWGSDRSKFGAPETTYEGRDICVTGQIKDYRGAPEIVARDRKQIKIRGEESR